MTYEAGCLTVDTNGPMTEESSYRPLQFSLRSLFLFTSVACVVLSIGGAAGAVWMLLLVVHIVLIKLIEADCRMNRDQVRKPLLALAAFFSLVILPLVFVPTFLAAVIAVVFLFRTLP